MRFLRMPLLLAGCALAAGAAAQAPDPQVESVRFGFDVRMGILAVHRSNPPDAKTAAAKCDAAKARATQMKLRDGQRGQLDLCFAGLARTTNDKAAACRGYAQAIALLEKDPDLKVDLGIAREGRTQAGC